MNVELLYPMSGLTTEEPVLKAGRINVLLGQGETAQVLRNLCLIVARESAADWQRVAGLMRRLFSVELGTLEQIFEGSAHDFRVYREALPEAARLIWDTKMERKKLSTFAEEFFRRLAERISLPVLLRKTRRRWLPASPSPRGQGGAPDKTGTNF